MYAPGLGQGKFGDKGSQRKERKEQIEAERQEARAMFPDLPIPEARKKYAALDPEWLRQYRAGKRESEAIQREFWPILGAIGAGLLVMTFLGKKRRR